MSNDVEEYLRHYASPYYDPVKAHEYYMENRELKGRRSTTNLSDEGKKAWSYTKNEITAEKKEKITAEQEANSKKVAALRENASAMRERISARLKELNEALTEKAAQRKASIESSNKTKIENLLEEEIPDNLSKEARARRIAERNEKIAKLRSDTKADKAQVTEDTKTERSNNSANASSERQQVSADLKTAIAAAREAYKAAKESINSSYEEIFQQEFEKIAAEMPKVSKSKKSSKK